jgi:hypothetical protein
MTEEAIAAWQAPVAGKRGEQPIYSAIAIETSLALRLVLHQSLRQTEHCGRRAPCSALRSRCLGDGAAGYQRGSRPPKQLDPRTGSAG